MHDRDAPGWVLTPTQAKSLALAAEGAYAPVSSFLSPGDVAAVRAGGHLADGTPWRGEPVLTVPDEVATAAGDAGRLLLHDPDGTTLAVLSVTAAMPAADGWTLLGGSLAVCARPRPIAFAALHTPVGELRAWLTGSPAVTVVQPLVVPDVPTMGRWRAHLDAAGGHLVVQPVLPEVPAEVWAALVRAHVRAAGQVDPTRTVVHLAPLPRDDEDPDAATLRAVVAANVGARTLLDADGVDPVVAASRGLELRPRPREDPGPRHLDVQAELDPAVRDGRRQGVVVFLTGLSGAGKSTIAQALRARLLESGERTVTLLDGDLVRRTLSRGLGFSPEDREVNVRRIGWVAAEVARHGGFAICAPIAPDDRVRKAVRADVAAAGGRFVLVHVDTSLEVCEARDVKGLYARARSGDLVGLTGVDAPYEPPDDAEVVVDTASVGLDDAVEVLLRATHGGAPRGHRDLTHRLCAN